MKPTTAGFTARRLIQAAFLAAFLVLLFGGQALARFAGHEDVFLWLDPLGTIAASLATRMPLGGLLLSGAALAVSLAAPRWFCGYACPLGTLIDICDAATTRGGPRVARGWWSGAKYYLLAAAVAAALGGTMLAGYVAALPLVSRGLAGAAALLGRGAPAAPRGAYVAATVLLAAALSPGLLRRRFWCRHICPTGALFSIVSFLRLVERRVGPGCVRCGKCADVCPFDAVRSDFGARATECASCRECARACPAGAVTFGRRARRGMRHDIGGDAAIVSRRSALAGAATIAGAVSLARLSAAGSGAEAMRPPASLPESDFLRACLRCGTCINACPSRALQPSGLSGGFERLWTPRLDTTVAGCLPDCNACGRACPTGAIRAVSLAEKQAARMGRASVNQRTCLPYNGSECGECFEECSAAGHDAVELQQVAAETDEYGIPSGESVPAPVVNAEKCVGCGLCRVRCHAVNVRDKGILSQAAIDITPDGADRIGTGSYLAMRQAERSTAPAPAAPAAQPSTDDYLPDFLK